MGRRFCGVHLLPRRNAIASESRSKDAAAAASLLFAFPCRPAAAHCSRTPHCARCPGSRGCRGKPDQSSFRVNSFEAGLAPSSSPAALYPFPCRIFRTAVINHLTDFTGHKKDRIAFEAGLVPSSSLATLYPFPCRILTIDSKKSTLPKQRALYMVCVLAGWRRIRQPSSPWPALRVPCCPRRRGQWQG